MPNPRAIIRILSETHPQTTSHNIGIKRVLLANDETPSSITQIAVTELRKGERAETHVHETMDEHYLFLSGRGIMRIDGSDVECEEGVFLLVPAGSEHSMMAETDMKFITIGVAL